MAAGVPVIAQNEWGWREMIVHGETGFLANNDCELAHFAALLAYDEDLRQTIIANAHERLCNELANPQQIWAKWKYLFDGLDCQVSQSSGSYHLQQLAEAANA